MIKAMIRRYKFLKAVFGLWSLLLFVYQFPRDNNREEEEKQKHDAMLKAFEFEKASPNPNMHFFVSCGGFV
ncbi:MAG: hypothetical protein A3C07_00860 [Candidatus Sungbacteria bacterium RIFCSPHIGHO2_02_FULL_47_11]|uniref:Uncharacterized protein n=1 Tax=Candidatus Sungbacteria bacterium RIFCSPHIGHO2_02_FULL_47_11 TaxID=1802270 RepID=A0A1G2KR38_9BACT|nr:MAG: hypothetical protein A3C07_00860 [Candidatus Sungbacteria bacterium RIFCSPHIGHO2_02_FULL_47_11]